jgi:NAD(P)H-dependent flavin oxidoreductase YrpB (nitropropane dioxygenase family)
MRNTFMDWFGLTAPILQAPIGSATNVALAAAVAKGGGMGSIAMTWTDKPEGLAAAAQLKATGHPFFFNFVLRFGTERPLWYRDAGLPAITLSWGIEKDLISILKAAGSKVGVQVGSSEGARAALAAGADFIIAQGIEAGGHVQSSTPLRQVLAETVAIAGTTPVIAAGGIAAASDIAAAIGAGAQGVMMGTRFLASVESSAHDAYKQVLVKARAEDTVYTNCFDIGWPYAMSRVLRNSTFNTWEAAGCPAAPNRPGEGDTIFVQSGEATVRYNDTPPAIGAKGDLLAGCLYAGTSVDGIDSVRPAAEIVSSLWAEAQSRLRPQASVRS